MNTRQWMLAIWWWLLLLFVGWIYVFLSLQNQWDQSPLQANIQQSQQTDTTRWDELVIDQVRPTSPKESTSKQAWEDTWTNNPLPQERIQEETNVLLLLPPFSDPVEWKTITDMIEVSSNIETNIQQFASRQAYKTALAYYLNNPEKVDLLLLPTEWLESFENRWANITFTQSITPYFHPLFRPYTEWEAFTFIPYAIDAPVTVYAKRLRFNNPSAWSLLTSVNSRDESDKTLWLLFWWSEHVGDILENREEPFRWYARILTQVLYQSIQTQRTDLLTFMMSNEHRDVTSMREEIEQATTTRSYCVEQPTLCLIEAWIWRLWFTHLSDIAHRTKHDQLKQTYITGFPITTTTYPLTGWWFIVNKHSSRKHAASSWIQSYLRLLNENEIRIPAPLFSAYNKHYQQQRILASYERFQPYQNNWNVIYDDLQSTERTIQNTAISAYFQKEISARVYLKQLIEFFSDE